MNKEAHYGTDPVLVCSRTRWRPQLVPDGLQPETGLAYFPQHEHRFVYALDPNFKPQPFRSNGGWGGYSGEALKKRQELQKLVT